MCIRDRLIGDGWKKNASELEKLLAFAGDDKVLERLWEIKQVNKKRLKAVSYTHLYPGTFLPCLLKSGKTG